MSQLLFHEKCDPICLPCPALPCPALPCPALPARRDSERFPEVLRWRGELAAGERALADQLLEIRRQLQISNLQYLSLQNQGEYLIEVPAELVRRVPKDWEKVRRRRHPCRRWLTVGTPTADVNHATHRMAGSAVRLIWF